MATCNDCKREMLVASTCLTVPMVIERQPYNRRRYPKAARARCYDCGVEPGGVHHFGCDEERCPRCRHQLIMCECAGKTLIRNPAFAVILTPPS